MKHHYDFLNASIEDSLEEIKIKYKTLAKKYHPDRGGNAEDFQKLGEAWEYVNKHHNSPEFKSKFRKAYKQAHTNTSYIHLHHTIKGISMPKVMHVNVLSLLIEDNVKVSMSINVGNIIKRTLAKVNPDKKATYSESQLLHRTFTVYNRQLDDLNKSLSITNGNVVLGLDVNLYLSNYSVYDTCAIYVENNLDVVIQINNSSKMNYIEHVVLKSKIEIPRTMKENEEIVLSGLGLISHDKIGNVIIRNKSKDYKLRDDEESKGLSNSNFILSNLDVTSILIIGGMLIGLLQQLFE